jgi:hypothetical protein
MVGAQTTTNNKLKAAAAMATETGTMTAAAMTMKMKATVVLNSYAKITFLPKRPQQTYMCICAPAVCVATKTRCIHRFAKDTILKKLFPPVLLRICVSVCELKKSQPYLFIGEYSIVKKDTLKTQPHSLNVDN